MADNAQVFHNQSFGRSRNALCALLLWSAMGFTTVYAEYEIRPLADYVSGWYGVINPDNQGHGPGPQMPTGSMQPGPETYNTSTNQCNDGYLHGQKVRGFSHMRRNGFWGQSAYGYMLFSVQNQVLQTAYQNYESAISDSVAQAGYFAAKLDKHNVRVEVTALHNAAIYRLTCPSSDALHMMLDLSYSQHTDAKAATMPATGGASDISFSIDTSSRTISGYIIQSGGWYGDKYYFCAQYSKPAKEVGAWQGQTTQAGELSFRSTQGSRSGWYSTFETSAEETLYFKIAVSFRSIENAQRYLQEQIPDWDFDAARGRAAAGINTFLSRVLIDDPNATQLEKSIYYSALYRAGTSIRDITGDSPWSSSEPCITDIQNLWDCWMYGLPFYSVLYPEIAAKILRSNLDIFSQFKSRGLKAVGKRTDGIWYEQLSPSMPEQGGENMDIFAWDCYQRELPGVDWGALAALGLHHAENARSPSYRTNGWVHIGEANVHMTTKGIDYYYDDYCVSRLAQALGATTGDVCSKYRLRAQSWVANQWNPNLTSDGFSGFWGPKDENGVYLAMDPKTGGPSSKAHTFCESSNWTYSWYLWWDFNTLFNQMGGRANALSRWQHFVGSIGYSDGNEPGAYTPLIAHYLGRPDLGSARTRNLLTAWNIEGKGGNDDGGHMSSFYALNALGIPTINGSGIHLLTAPLFSDVTIQLDPHGSKKLRIIANGLSDENIYIQSATLNGTALTRAWITAQEFNAGGTLTLQMGSAAGNWGTAPSDLPPSDSSTVCDMSTPSAPKPLSPRLEKKTQLRLELMRNRGMRTTAYVGIHATDATYIDEVLVYAPDGRIVAVLAKTADGVFAGQRMNAIRPGYYVAAVRVKDEAPRNSFAPFLVR